jgi:hypothetical protein
LKSRLHSGNKGSLSLFTKITGLSTKTQKETDASLRALDPVAYDKWVEDSKAEREAKDREAEQARKEQEKRRMLDAEVNYKGQRMSFEKYIDALIADGYTDVRIEKKGPFKSLRLLKKGKLHGTDHFRKKSEIEYIENRVKEHLEKQISEQADPVSARLKQAESEMPEGLTIHQEQNARGDKFVSVKKDGKIVEKLTGFGYTEHGIEEAVRLANRWAETKKTEKTPPDPKPTLIKDPSGTFSFVGHVDPRLIYKKTDPGETITEAEFKELSRSSNPAWAAEAMGIESRTFKTEQDAVEFARSLGIEIQKEPALEAPKTPESQNAARAKHPWEIFQEQGFVSYRDSTQGQQNLNTLVSNGITDGPEWVRAFNENVERYIQQYKDHGFKEYWELP